MKKDTKQNYHLKKHTLFYVIILIFAKKDWWIYILNWNMI